MTPASATPDSTGIAPLPNSSAARSADTRKQFLRFVAVGAGNTALALGLYTLLLAIRVPYPVASVLAFALTAVNGYRLNRKWTFHAGPFSSQALVRYLCVRLSGIGLSSMVLVFLVEGVGMGTFLGQVVALPAVSVSAFFATRRWVFSDGMSERA